VKYWAQAAHDDLSRDAQHMTGWISLSIGHDRKMSWKFMQCSRSLFLDNPKSLA
jgi:hypothetical protein